MYNRYPKTEEEKTLWFRAEMNNRQFKALSHRLINSDIENEILNNNYFLYRVSKSANFSNIEVSQWLKNSWNTESILIQNEHIIENTNQSFCMQWAFPQAYYAVFGNILAMFKSIGFTETSHTAVIKKYNSLMSEEKLPESISLYCDGIDGNFTFLNIDVQENIDGQMDLNFDKKETIDNQICQFLRATRKLRLKEKAPQMKFRTKSGQLRKNLTPELWGKVSISIGPTSVIDFLYRKRIKGNYQDIETYNCPYFDGKTVLNNLLNVVSRINLTNEIYISKAIGIENYKSIAEFHLNKVDNKYLKERLEITEQIIKACR